MNLKQKIEEKLKISGVAYRLIPLPENLPMDIASHAAFHKIKMAQAMATIIYKTEKGLIGAVKRADTQIDKEKIKKLVGVRELIFASKEDLNSLGVETGLVPYVGLDIPYFVDSKVLETGTAYGTGGSKIVGLAMEARDVVKVNLGKVGEFTFFENTIDIHGSTRYRIVSGITPSGDGSLHIGNYLGAVKQFVEIAKTNECFLFIADLHALTTIQDRETLKKNTETLILNELALLGDLKNITFFRQSDIPMHTELQSILNNVTPLGLIMRAHAYKDKLATDISEDEVNMGLFNYPILMASDILLYKPDLVPVGKDQKQHIEITRDIAERFNKIFSKIKRDQPSRGLIPNVEYKNRIFPLPEPYIPEDVAVILGTDGKRKMSKSLGNLISIFEEESVIRKQVMGTFTDPTRAHTTDTGHIEGNMVFVYLDHFGERVVVDQLKEKYCRGGVGDVEVKDYLFESLMKTFAPARERYQELINSPKKVKVILEKGAEKAGEVAAATMKEVREAIGLTNTYSFFSYIRSGPAEKSGMQGQVLQSKIISIDEFASVEMRVGKVVEATNVEKSEKLIKLTVDFDVLGKRTILAGLRSFGYTPENFLGKQYLFATNLQPKRMGGEESQGMLLCVEDSKGKPLFFSAEGMPLGAKIR